MQVKFKRLLSMLFCTLLLLTSFNVNAEENIQHSTVDYEASFRDATQIYIGNKTPVKWKVGDKYFLHYTVTDLEKNDTNQSGLLVTKNQDAPFPYLEGGMHYANESLLCEEGWTYLFRFEVTESGLKYVAGKAKGTASSYIQFPFTAGEIKTKAPYFGVWLTGTKGESLTASLSNIRCYDEKGNDLGIYAPKAMNIKISDMNTKNVNHSYSFSVSEVACLAFGSSKFTDSDVITMEYTVRNVDAKNVTQSGAEFTNAPTAYFPHGNDMGYLNYDFNTDEKPTKLITKGASYVVRFVRGEEKFDVLVKRTMPNGAVDYFSFANYYGTYDSKFGYVAMWIGQECKVSADFTNVKCYDEKGNNLGIQTNKGVKVTHVGELEDYSQCFATYYCKANDSMVILNDESNVIQKDVTGDTSVQGSYKIENGVLSVTVGEQTDEYEYAYEFFRDKEGNKYIRLRDYKVTFMTKQVGGKEISTENINAQTGYQIAQPEDPTDGTGKFLGWVDAEGKAYDFNSVVTESMTLYASWDGEPSWEILKMLSQNDGMIALIVTGVACTAMVVGTVAISIIQFRKRKQDAGKN